MAVNPKSYDVERCLQSEQSVLGCALITDRVIPIIRSYLTPEKFYHKQCQYIFKAICNLVDTKSPVDVVTIAEELRKKNLLDACGGGSFLAELMNLVPFADHAEYYAKVVAGYYYEREIITASGQVAMQQSAESLEALRSVVLAREQLGLPDIFDYSKDLFDILDNLMKKKTGRRHTVGFPTLDKVFGGLAPGEVVTWGAATNMGKSLILLNIMSHCAQRGEPVLYVGTEMSAQETVARHLSILTGVEPHKIKSANVNADELARLQNALSDRMYAMPIKILDLAEPSLSDLDSALSSSRRQHIFCDYLERFKMPPGDNYRLRVGEFMRRLKNLARRHDAVVHLASQLSRSVYGHEERRPTLADLSESSSIEKESDRVMLVWAPKDKNKEPSAADPFPTRVLEAVMAKNRHGRRGMSVDLVLNEKSLQITETQPELTQAPEFS